MNGVRRRVECVQPPHAHVTLSRQHLGRRRILVPALCLHNVSFLLSEFFVCVLRVGGPLVIGIIGTVWCLVVAHAVEMHGEDDEGRNEQDTGAMVVSI